MPQCSCGNIALSEAADSLANLGHSRASPKPSASAIAAPPKPQTLQDPKVQGLWQVRLQRTPRKTLTCRTTKLKGSQVVWVFWGARLSLRKVFLLRFLGLGSRVWPEQGRSVDEAKALVALVTAGLSVGGGGGFP